MLRHLTDSDRAVVERATGALMLHFGTGSRESLAVLDRWASGTGVSLPEIADALVNGIGRGRVTPGTEHTVRWLEQQIRRDTRAVMRLAEEGEPAAALAQPRRPDLTPTVPRPRATERSQAAGTRQWRYSSAVHAAQTLRTR